MNYRALTSEDIQVFSEAISTFFERMTRQPAKVRTAYMLNPPEAILWNDFNGVIQVSGGFRGSVCFSAPRGLLLEVLSAIGETEESPDNFLDVAGEIANILSRRYGGSVTTDQQQGNVVRLGLGPGEAVDRIDDGLHRAGHVRLRIGQQSLHRRFAELGAIDRLGLGNAIRVEQQPAAARKRNLAGAEHQIRDHPRDRIAWLLEELGRGPGQFDQRRVVADIDVMQQAAVEIEDRAENRDKQLGFVG